MIEFAEEQMQALEHSEAGPPRVVNPRTKEAFVLLRADEYKRLKDDEYDDSPWTREEVQAVARETAERAGWEEWNDSQRARRKIRWIGARFSWLHAREKTTSRNRAI